VAAMFAAPTSPANTQPAGKWCSRPYSSAAFAAWWFNMIFPLFQSVSLPSRWQLPRPLTIPMCASAHVSSFYSGSFGCEGTGCLALF
jgi:hypothetical protein